MYARPCPFPLHTSPDAVCVIACAVRSVNCLVSKLQEMAVDIQGGRITLFSVLDPGSCLEQNVIPSVETGGEALD